MATETSSGTVEKTTGTTVTCPNCGGRVEFDIKSRRFMCTACRSVVDTPMPKSAVEEYSIDGYSVRERTGQPLSGMAVAVCSTCGGEIFFESSETAKQCPMCGSTQIRVAQASAGIAPEGIVPFRIDAADAQQRFRQWISKRWFAPNLLKKAYAEGKLEGLYVPYWTYDADTCADYSGQGGRTRTVRDRDGNTKTVTDWYPVSGRVYAKFDDVLVCASQKHSGAVSGSLAPYNTVGDILPFTYQFLSGYKAERYSIDGLTCFNKARVTMETSLRSRAESDILAKGFSQANVTGFHPMYKDVTYKSVLLPMYSASYHYQGKLYSYAINGETGRVQGNYPKSAAKIVGAVVLGLLLLFGLMYLFGFMESDDPDYGYGGGWSSANSYSEESGAARRTDISQENGAAYLSAENAEGEQYGLV